MNRILFLLHTVLVMACVQSNTETKPAEESTQIPRVVLSDSSIIAIPVGYQFPEGETFSVLSWNVEHFVDPFDDPYINNRREDEPSPDMPRRVQLLVDAIRIADADVVVFQEFESEKYLMTLARDSFPELGYQFFSDAASPDWYMNVVLMSRFPLGTLRAYGDVTTPVTGFLDAEDNRQTQNHLNTRMWTMRIFASPSYEFWLTSVHLKAGRGPRNEAMRTGQINFLNQQFEELTQLNPDVNLMMAGDFNVYPNSDELKLLTDTRKKTHLLDPMDSTTWTHPSNKPARRLDYILVNSGMAKEMVASSVRPVHFFNSDSMRMISDHLPVMGEFFKTDQ